MIENNFLEVKKATNSITYGVEQHWRYVWLFM